MWVHVYCRVNCRHRHRCRRHSRKLLAGGADLNAVEPDGGAVPVVIFEGKADFMPHDILERASCLCDGSELRISTTCCLRGKPWIEAPGGYKGSMGNVIEAYS